MHRERYILNAVEFTTALMTNGVPRWSLAKLNIIHNVFMFILLYGDPIYFV